MDRNNPPNRNHQTPKAAIHKKLPPRTIAAALPGEVCEACGLDHGYLHEGLRFRYRIIVCQACVENAPNSGPIHDNVTNTLQFPVKIYHNDVYSIPDRYRSVTKTAAKNEFMLTDQDISSLTPFLQKNPHSTLFSSMYLYLLTHVLDVAYRKYNGAEELNKIKREKSIIAMESEIARRAYEQHQDNIIQHGIENNLDSTITYGRLLIEERKMKAQAKLKRVGAKHQRKQKEFEERRVKEENEQSELIDDDNNFYNDDNEYFDDNNIDLSHDADIYDSFLDLKSSIPPTTTTTTKPKKESIYSRKPMNLFESEANLLSQWYGGGASETDSSDGDDDDADDADDADEFDGFEDNNNNGVQIKEPGLISVNGPARNAPHSDNFDRPHESTNSEDHLEATIPSNNKKPKQVGSGPRARSKPISATKRKLESDSDGDVSCPDDIEVAPTRPLGKASKVSKISKRPTKKPKNLSAPHTHAYVRVGVGIDKCECGATQEYEEL